jgi:Na+-driven multidrug efflux pump
MLYMEAGNPFKDEILYQVKSITTLLLFTYFLCGIMEVISATLRSMGYAFITMIISIIGICGLRALWVFLVFPTEAFHTPVGLMTSYPVTWSITALGHLTLWFVVWIKFKKKLKAKAEKTPEPIA